jgi:hypothetical protein
MVIHVNRGRSTRGPKRHCKFCGEGYYGGKLCDYPVGNGRTCDAQMCDECARTLGLILRGESWRDPSIETLKWRRQCK